jgi:hypothetical protein
MQRNVSRKDTLFFSARLEKKERDVSFSLRSSLFFPFVSLFQNELLPSSYFPTTHTFAVLEKVITEKTTASEDVIYILTYIHRYTRHTKHIAILYDSQ